MLATVIIFWSAMFAILFFACELFLKALVSSLKAFLESVATILVILICSGLVVWAMDILYSIIMKIAREGFMSVFMELIEYIIVISFLIAASIMVGLAIFIGAIMSAIGFIIELCCIVIDLVIKLIIDILEFIAGLFEKGFKKLVINISNQLGVS